MVWIISWNSSYYFKEDYKVLQESQQNEPKRAIMLMCWLNYVLVSIVLLIPTSIARPEVIVASHGAVATDDRRCSKIGVDVLREGGHVIDATVAAALCLGVVSPASSGIGGGAFMLFRSTSGKSQVFDMRETAPFLASENMYDDNVASKVVGALSVAVPGELAGLHEAWKQHGKLPWARLVQPAERLARLGFNISPNFHMQMVKTESGIFRDEGLRNLLTSNGKLLNHGDIVYNKKLAKTLRTISRFGVEVFYNGSIGIDMIRDIRKLEGLLSMKDLQSYRVKIRVPILSHMMGLEIITIPPPSGGSGVILMLNILAQYKLPSGILGPLGIHRKIEAMKHVVAVRTNLGDPEFYNVSQVLSDMLSPKFAQQLKKTIDDNRTFDPSHYGTRWNPINDHGTSHLSVVDGERNTVSMTTTVNHYFGAQILSPSTGIVLNNQMDDFSVPGNVSAHKLRPAPANFIRPGKRPLSSMSPTIVLKDGQLKAVVGASGGGFIIAGVTEVLLNHFAKGMDPFSSVMAPKAYHQLIPNILNYENWTNVFGDHFEVPAKTRASLAKKGHVLEGIRGGAVCQFIVQSFSSLRQGSGVGKLVAVSDPRKGGAPAGFEIVNSWMSLTTSNDEEMLAE
ncbi:glutathione hydrolase 1-like [Benincasa hispida]|uniref:glutathione hydrolase 1-like n=1 Tax=Benincasa hispida TaxID=102211 RepID=UPI0018FFE544|nr:glutathione hydrolase 1-like [Benincasa hispida]